MCHRQQEIKPVEKILCEKYRNIPCEGEPPLLNPVTRKEYNCSEETCPMYSYCHRGLNFAKCCREIDPDEDCEDTTYGYEVVSISLINHWQTLYRADVVPTRKHPPLGETTQGVRVHVSVTDLVRIF